MNDKRECYSADNGDMSPYSFNPKRIFGFGFTYRSHVKEVGNKSMVNVLPPIFKKDITSLAIKPLSVQIPRESQLLEMAERKEPGLGAKIKEKCGRIDPLMDYEVELAFVLLDDVNWSRLEHESYTLRIGFFLSNDISSRFIQILGEGQENRFEYWGASKSFPGFLPVNDHIWIPKVDIHDAVPCVELKCTVNEDVRQQEMTSNCIYSPKQMLRFVSQKYPDDLPVKGDILLTGTPEGVALQVPAWKTRISELIKLSRFSKLNNIMRLAKKTGRFLKSGDVITFSGEILGTLKVNII
jgi:2-keto-4-pentenoate hydratase/2-oxohepta-3-ene-1,7-dioic acid hydratase in catechol pathway